jgi:hypothetical protein
LLEELGPGDVYAKGVNAIDAHGWVGVLRASLAEGTIGLALNAAQRRGFHLLFPAGFEKLVPGRLEEAARIAARRKDYAMGVPVNVFAFPGETVTEMDAFRLLTSVEATVISAGGLGGAEGAVTLVLSGDSKMVTKAVELAEQVKGARLPEPRLPDCRECAVPTCRFPGWEKPWFGLEPT